MNEQPEKPLKTEFSDERHGFNNYKQALKALRALERPLNERDITGYLAGIRACPTAPYIAFQLLTLRAVGDRRTELAPFINGLEEILHQGSEPIDLRNRQSVEDIQRPILQRLGGLKGNADLKNFAAAWNHLPVLYAIIRVWDDKARFQTALDALAAQVGRLTAGKRSRVTPVSNNLEILARALANRVPEKAIVGKSLAELLEISHTLFRESADMSRENLAFEAKLTAAESELSLLHDQMITEIETRQATEKQITALRKELTELQSNLKEEREHFDTLKGHSEQDRARVVADAIARIRAEVLRRLENIRLFADREQPNRAGILNLINEITESLADKGGHR